MRGAAVDALQRRFCRAMRHRCVGVAPSARATRRPVVSTLVHLAIVTATFAEAREHVPCLAHGLAQARGRLGRLGCDVGAVAVPTREERWHDTTCAAQAAGQRGRRLGQRLCLPARRGRGRPVEGRHRERRHGALERQRRRRYLRRRGRLVFMRRRHGQRVCVTNLSSSTHRRRSAKNVVREQRRTRCGCTRCRSVIRARRRLGRTSAGASS